MLLVGLAPEGDLGWDERPRVEVPEYEDLTRVVRGEDRLIRGHKDAWVLGASQMLPRKTLDGHGQSTDSRVEVRPLSVHLLKDSLVEGQVEGLGVELREVDLDVSSSSQPIIAPLELFPAVEPKVESVLASAAAGNLLEVDPREL